MAQRFTNVAQNILNTSISVAMEMGHTYIGSEHILFALLTEKESAASRILLNKGITADKLKNQIHLNSGKGEKTVLSPADMTPSVKKLIHTSSLLSQKHGQKYIGSEHLLLALLSDSDCVGSRLIATFGVSAKEVSNEITEYFRDFSDDSLGIQSINSPPPEADDHISKKINKNQKNCPTLYKYGRDMTEYARLNKIDPIIGRDKETERVIQILSRRTKNNPCLIGEAGVGKTAVIEGLAQRIVNSSVPESLIGKSIFALDIASMVAGSKYRGEFEDRMKNVLNELQNDNSIILFLDEIHTIVGAGGAEGAVDASNIIKPALARGEFQVIGATTIEEYRRYIEKDPALERRFQSVLVNEPSTDESIKILQGLREKYESFHNVRITDEAINAAVSLSQRYITDRFLPDKAIDLIDEAASHLKISKSTRPLELKETEELISKTKSEKEEAIINQDFELAAVLRDREKELKEKFIIRKNNWSSNSENNIRELTAEDIAKVVTQWTSIPISKLETEEEIALSDLEESLKKRVIGQDEAINEIANAIRRSRIGIKDPNRPSASFIFLGSTGVGKTELSKALAETVFCSKNSFIRFDMSEFMEKHSVAKLIGAPPGYIGYGEGGLLTEKVRRTPYSVVLFDEIEKAHADVLNILLQILEDGILHDSEGRSVSFRNAIIILTSNVGAGELSSRASILGFSSKDVSEDRNEHSKRIKDALQKAFRPEFIGRVDEIIVFNNLDAESIRKIILKMIGEVIDRAKIIGLNISVSDSAVNYLTNAGFDSQYGARPLRRLIQKNIEDKLATGMINGEIKADDTIVIEEKNEKIQFTIIS